MSHQENRRPLNPVLLAAFGIALLGLWGCEESPSVSQQAPPPGTTETPPDTADTIPETRTIADRPAPPAEKLSPQQEVLAALDDAIASLATRDYIKFCIHYLPVRDFQKLRDSNGFDKIVDEIGARPEGMQVILGLLKQYRDCKPTFDETGLLATFTPPPAEPDQKPPQPAVVVAAPEDDDLALSGFGDDLEAVIGSAIAALEKGELQTFIDRMFPAGELGRLKANNETARLLARLKGNPDMVRQMIADLKAIQGKKPQLDSDQTVATFVVPVPAPKPQNKRSKKPKPLDKTFEFQKVEGNWRLFDNSTKVRQEMVRQAKLAPPRFKTREVSGLVMEKLGTCWRIAKFPRPL